MACIISQKGNLFHVLDGGALLHRVPWFKEESYSVIFERYNKYINGNFKSAIVVFDGYDSGPSTKDIAHIRRSKIVGCEVEFTERMSLTTRKVEFLSNFKNNSCFFKLLSSYLNQRNVETVSSEGDADCLIVTTAIEHSQRTDTAVIGDHTDLLVLLLYHGAKTNHKLFLFNQGKNGKKGKCWDIFQILNILIAEVCNSLLFIHAVLECDTTSRLHGIGKGGTLKLAISNNRDFFEAANIFLDESSDKKN